MAPDTLQSYGEKPKELYLKECFRLYEKLWDAVVDDPNSIKMVTGLFLAACLDKEIREKMFADHLDLINKVGATDASILMSGRFFTYLSETFDFT
jgi:hypothetical protein